MSKTPLALLAALAAARASAATPGVLASLEEEQRALFSEIAPAVAVISTGTSISAGVLVAPDLVLTAAHGLSGATRAVVTLHDGRTVAGEVIAFAPGGLDLALLRVDARSDRALAPDPNPSLRAGDLVAAVGHGDGSRWSFASGMVSNPLADGVDGSLVRLQLALRPGASGAPVVSRAGRLVGVVVQGDPSAVAFAVRSDAILRAFPALAAAPPPNGTGPIAQADAAAAEPLRAPEPIFGPPDPRPSDAHAVRTKASRAKVAHASFPARAKRQARPARAPVLAEETRDAGTMAGELVPAAALATGGLALAALVLAAVAAASTLAPTRRRARLAPAPRASAGTVAALSAAPAPPRGSSRRRDRASAA